MRYLLDTQVLVWLEAGARLPGRLNEELEVPTTTLFYSVVSLWELAIKRSLDKLKVDPTAIEEAAEKSQIDLLLVKPSHCFGILELPHHHRDPFDRMLVAQAQAENLTLLTADAQLAAYGSHIRVL